MAGYQRYAEATGDAYHLVRAACNVGMRLLGPGLGEMTARGALAVGLARTALEHAPHDEFAWALWGRALEAQGALVAAEEVWWESVRRYPEDPDKRNQLAKLIGRVGRAGEAARLLRETMGLFPADVVARNQLASVLDEGLDRPREAAQLLREAIAAGMANAYSYNQLASVLADRLGEKAAALEVLREAVAREAGDDVTLKFLGRLKDGRRLRGQRRLVAEGATVEVDVGLPSAWARRGLFLVETGGAEADVAAVRRQLEVGAGSAYGRYVAQRAGWRVAGGMENVFAFAFDRAVRAGSAAALRMLMDHAQGVDRYVVQSATSLLEGGAAGVLPGFVNDLDAQAPLRRLGGMTAGIGAALKRGVGQPTDFIRLYNDFAASGLSLVA